MEERIEIMQHNLKLIKEFLGLRTVEFAEELGCTRQLINYLETGKHKMSQIQYMAIMYLLESKLKEGKLNSVQWRFLQDYLLSIKMSKKNTYEEEIL